VGKSPDYTATQGVMSIKDTRSSLILSVSGEEQSDRYIYHVSGEGEAANGPFRLKAVVAGFVRYGEMEKVGETEVSFSCGQRHDGLMRILLPYSILLGGSFLVIADSLARTLIAPQQLPVGVVTAIIGVPSFIIILRSTITK